MKFAEYIERWKSKARVRVSEGWKITQGINLRLHILPYLGHLDVAAITPEHISTVIQASIDQGHSANQTKQIYLLLSKCFKDAISFFRILRDSPVLYAFHCPVSAKKEQPYLTLEEAQKLMEYAKYHWSIQAIVLQIYTGVRVGEVIALRWHHVDWKKREILVREKYNRKTRKIDNYPKGKKWGRVPIAGDLLPFLDDLYSTLKPTENDFVCQAASGGMMSYNAYQKALKHLCKGAGVPVVGSHGFRHTASMLWKKMGATIDDRKTLLNHESVYSTRTYDHDDHERLTEFAGKVMNLLKRAR